MNFNELHKTDFQLINIFALHQKWSNGDCFTMESARKTAALLYLEDCSAEYSMGTSKRLNAPCGSVVFIPKGAVYRTVFTSQNDTGTAILIEFTAIGGDGNALLCGDDPFLLQSDISPYTADHFKRAADIFSASVIRYPELRSVIYSLLSEFSLRGYKKEISSREFAPISPAILYLEQTPCPTLSITELSEMCHVSPAYFRRLFHKYASVSPIQYRNNSRIEYAKKLLAKEEYSVSEISAAVGFEGSAYFCRAFKKATGYTPGEYVAIAKGQHK